VGLRPHSNKWEKEDMKTFKQINDLQESGVGPHSQPMSMDGNMNMAALENPQVVRSLNTFVGAIANQPYELPEQAIAALREKLSRVGLEFEPTPAMTEKKGSFDLKMSLFGGRFGKDENTPFNEFLKDDGISNKVEGGLSLKLNYEMLENNACKITASIS
tara:strand:+ start:1760 stop:2239 length:480 start_codon:yes stop_codon:yes gene_type:complete